MKYNYFLSKYLISIVTLFLVSCSTSDDFIEEELVEEIIFEPRPARELDQIVRVMEEGDPNLDPDFDWVEPRNLWVYAREESFAVTDGALITLPYYDGQSILNSPSKIDKPEDGWVLMAKDFGTESSSRKGLPFFALYNTESGIMRFMFLNLFAYRMSEARVTLGYLDPEKSGRLLDGMDTRINRPDHVEYDPYFEVTRNTKFDQTGGWGVVDFELQFDPELHKETILDFNIFFVLIWTTYGLNEETGEKEVISVREDVEKYQHVRLSLFDDTWLNDGTTYKNLYSGALGK
jgi:hypothetical protein